MKDKGFTLVELLAVLVILGILILIGTMTVSNIFDNSAKNFYKSMENTLGIAGNEFFNDNREDKPIDDYSFVDMDTLVNHEYLEELKTYDGKNTCDPKTGVYIYNTDSGNQYEVCLICGDYKSSGPFCNGKKFGTINISGNINTPDGTYYNPLLSYSRTSWINASSVYIHFSLDGEDISVTEYQVYDSNTSKQITSCTAGGNKCYVNITTSGSYYVEAYGIQDGAEKKVANRKYFNVKIDNTAPTFDLAKTDPDLELEKDNIIYEYENEVIDIHDDNGYREVTYTLKRFKGKDANGNDVIETLVENKDIKSQDLKIKEKLESGKYYLDVKVTDFAGNVGTSTHSHLTFYIRYKVDLEFFDNKENKHEVGGIKVYTYGKYQEEDISGKVLKKLPESVDIHSGEPQAVTWYRNANLVGEIVTSNNQVIKTGHHVLYGNEQKMRVSFTPKCNNLTYNGDVQQLATIKESEQGKYRLIALYRGNLVLNQGRDARVYTLGAVLNDEYTWTDGTRNMRTIQCEIYPKQVPIPSCTNPTYEPRKSQQLINVVDSKGEYYEFGELAISTVGNSGTFTTKPVMGMNAGSYSMTTSINKKTMNFSWEGNNKHDFSDKTHNCVINKKPISFPGITCAYGRYTGGVVMLIKGLSEGGFVVDPKDGNNSAGSGEMGGGIEAGEMPEMPEVPWDTFDGNYYPPGEWERDSGGVSPYSISPLAGLNAGPYDVKVTLNPNYTWSGNVPELKCKILPAVVTPTPSFSLEFDDYPIGSTYTDDKDYSINPTAAFVIIELTYTIKSINYSSDTFTASVSISNVDTYAESDSGASNLELGKTSATIKIEDTTDPECDDAGSTVDEVPTSKSTTVIFKATDNYKFSDLSTEASFTLTTNTSGDKKHTFVDAFNNSVECTVPVKIVRQKRTSSCKKHKSCVNDNCSCKTYNSCATSACGCDTYKTCVDSACGCDTYKTCVDSACGCDTYKSCATSGCGCKERNSCENSVCGCASDSAGYCSKYNSCVNDNCTCKTWKTCENSSCGCDTYKSCATSGCGCDTYKSCATSGCGCDTYKTCEDSACGCKERNSCVDDSCECEEWNDPTDWVDDANCTEGTTTSTKTECQNVYRKG